MSEPMLCGHTYFENANKCAACLEAENARLQRERNVLNAMWTHAEGENKKLEAENARLQFELTAARNEIEIADGVIKRLQAKNARLRDEAIVSKCGRELEKN